MMTSLPLYLSTNLVISVQIQDVVPVSSYDTTGSFLLLGCDNGCIYNIGQWLSF